jgi:hypothetical protein
MFSILLSRKIDEHQISHSPAARSDPQAVVVNILALISLLIRAAYLLDYLLVEWEAPQL